MLAINYYTKRHSLHLKNLLFSNIMQSHSRCHSTGPCILHLNQIQRVLNRLESVYIPHYKKYLNPYVTILNCFTTFYLGIMTFIAKTKSIITQFVEVFKTMHQHKQKKWYLLSMAGFWVSRNWYIHMLKCMCYVWKCH